MKKLVIIGVILIGGGIFAGCMFEGNKKVTEPKKTEQTVTKIDNGNIVSQIDPQKAKNDNTNIKDNSGLAENSESLNNINKIQNTENNKTNKSEIENSNEKSPEVNNSQPQINNSGGTSSQVQDDKSSSVSQNIEDKNIINNDANASDLVKKYYENKYPSINQSNWSTDVIGKQTIDGKTGYLVRLYDYINSHSNNIAWILVEENGTMYSTEAGSGPLVKLS